MGAAWTRLRGYQPISQIRVSHLTRWPDHGLSISSPRFTLYLLKLSVTDPDRKRPMISAAQIRGISRFLHDHSIPPTAKMSRRRFETEFRHQSVSGGGLSEASQAYRTFLLTTILSSPHLASPIQRSLVCSLQLTSDSSPTPNIWWRTWGAMWTRFSFIFGKGSPSQGRNPSAITLTPYNLRRTWSSPVSSGQWDRAHILSLSLTCQLWRLIHGHSRISLCELNQLRTALSRPNNCLITSQHVNRGLHVKYDNEILKRLAGASPTNSLTWGALNRVHMIIDILNEMQKDFPELVPFLRAARQRLKQLC